MWASRPLYGLQNLSVGHEQVLLTLPYQLVFSFTNASSISPHVSAQQAFFHGNLAPYCHCRIAPLKNILCWAFFKIICVGFMGLFGAIYHPLRKGPIFASFTKGLQVHTLRSCSNCERNIDNLATFASHHHEL